MSEALGLRPARRRAPVPLSQTDRVEETTNVQVIVPPSPVPDTPQQPQPGAPEVVLPPPVSPREEPQPEPQV